MKIAIVSGKGGTGKTTIATSLAMVLANEMKVYLLDCDVEAPNAHLFLKPNFQSQETAITLIPQIQNEICSLCGKCVQVCQFHALAQIGQSILIFPQLCHGCGSCAQNCPSQAIVEQPYPIGELEAGVTSQGIHFFHGKLTISEPMPTPIIRQLKRWSQFKTHELVILDAPPGASCSVVETLKGADFALLVTEPTPFGLHDLRQIFSITQEMKIQTAVIINRDGIGQHDEMETFIHQNHLEVLMRIPFDPNIAAGIAAGKTLIAIQPEFQEKFKILFQKILQISSKGKL